LSNRTQTTDQNRGGRGSKRITLVPKILLSQAEILECQLQFSQIKPNYMKLKAENRSKRLNPNRNF